MNKASKTDITVAVVVPTCDMQRYNKLKNVIESLMQQSHKIQEIIIVANGSRELGEKLEADYQNYENIKVIIQEEFLGAAQARNIGIKITNSDIVAFTDDDSTADRKWIEKLLEVYIDGDAIAVGGKVLPVWLVNKPNFLPEEFYWLVGATHEKIFRDGIIEVRNTFGPNMSYKKNVLESVGYFNEKLGFNKSSNFWVNIGGEEQELGLRIINKFGRGIVYTSEATVYHEIPAGKTQFKTLIKRAFYFGVTKRMILRMDRFKNNMDTEKSYLARVVTDFIPDHFAEMFKGPAHLTAIKKLAFLLVVVTAIGLGFVYGYVASK
jgi:glucosyl-dolichyl phosphate glucuronosyltransferase